MNKNTWKNIDVGTIEIDDINTRDYPDFCDAFISAASYEDGTDASEDDVQIWSEQCEDTFYEMILEECY